jgi:amino-acid N-acetyltransferase
MRIERATPGDLPAVEALLVSSGLPLDGVAEAFAERGLVARADDGRVVGAAAIERYGEAGLLRSVVVAAELHGGGVGRALVAAAEARATGEGMTALHLLTETAADWFGHLGWERIGRDTAAGAIGGSVEFRTACSVRAIAMRRRL